MSDSVTWSFDQAMAEVEAKPLVVEAFGERLELAPDMPAQLVLLFERIRMSAEDPEKAPPTLLPNQELIDAYCAVFGEERVQRWVREGKTMVQLGTLLRGVMALYNGRDPDEAVRPEGQAPDPEPGASDSPTSSSSSPSSEAISDASTASTSPEPSPTG
jgi:hypothetical protein